MPVHDIRRSPGPSTSAEVDDRPGKVRARGDVPAPAAYAVFDCETTGIDPGRDEIVSLAVVRLDADGVELSRYARLVRPSRSIPAEATAVHGIADDDVAGAPPFAQIAHELNDVLDSAVFVAHNVGFDLPMLQNAFRATGSDYRPEALACTLEAFRLVEPLADNHRLESICARRGIALRGAHEAMSDVLATVALVRVLLAEGLAPETVELDHSAYLRVRSRGDTRLASDPQIRRVFGMARFAGLVGPDGAVDRSHVGELVERVAGTADVDSLTRAQIQDVYDALDDLIEQRASLPTAAHG